ncbi:GntR family transcriptional regulator, partial [Francisella tularensis subsp. holarctica]|nr:GntR family transcriptional regulator [Francisella tularensis subsp. holarctica]
PEDIIREVGISKAAFQLAIGTLLKLNKVVIRDSGIDLNG